MNKKFDEVAKTTAQTVWRGQFLRYLCVEFTAGVLLVATAGSFAQPTVASRAAKASLSLVAPFTRITTGPVATESAYSWGCAWADYDNDGFIDLFVENSYEAANSLLA